MKRKQLFIGIIVASIATSAAITIVSVYNNSSPTLVSSSAQTTDTKAFMDSISYDSVKTLVSNSDIVVRGEVIKKSSKSRNLAKNPLNPTEDAKDRKSMSQEYEFEITKWLKGNGDNIINIVYPEYTDVNGKKLSEENEPLKEGKEYVLFLSHGIEDTYFGSAEPWQFRVNSNKIFVDSKASGIKLKDLKDMTVEELESLVK